MNTSKQGSLACDEGHICHKIKTFRTTQLSYINNKKNYKAGSKPDHSALVKVLFLPII